MVHELVHEPVYVPVHELVHELAKNYGLIHLQYMMLQNLTKKSKIIEHELEFVFQ